MSASRPKMSLWEFFQSLGKTFMLPVALLSFCGILLGIGSSLSSHDVLTLIPMLDQPFLQYLFIWRETTRKRIWDEVATYHGFCQSLTARRFTTSHVVTSFCGNFLPHICPTHLFTPDFHKTLPLR